MGIEEKKISRRKVLKYLAYSTWWLVVDALNMWWPDYTTELKQLKKSWDWRGMSVEDEQWVSREVVLSKEWIISCGALRYQLITKVAFKSFPLLLEDIVIQEWWRMLTVQATVLWFPKEVEKLAYFKDLSTMLAELLHWVTDVETAPKSIWMGAGTLVRVG